MMVTFPMICYGNVQWAFTGTFQRNLTLASSGAQPFAPNAADDPFFPLDRVLAASVSGGPSAHSEAKAHSFGRSQMGVA